MTKIETIWQITKTQTIFDDDSAITANPGLFHLSAKVKSLYNKGRVNVTLEIMHSPS